MTLSRGMWKKVEYVDSIESAESKERVTWIFFNVSYIVYE